MTNEKQIRPVAEAYEIILQGSNAECGQIRDELDVTRGKVANLEVRLESNSQAYKILEQERDTALAQLKEANGKLERLEDRFERDQNYIETETAKFQQERTRLLEHNGTLQDIAYALREENRGASLEVYVYKDIINRAFEVMDAGKPNKENFNLEIERIVKELATLRKDKERLDWLEDNTDGCQNCLVLVHNHSRYGSCRTTIDHALHIAIDTAIKQEKI